LARHSLPSSPHFHGHVLCEYVSIHVLGSQLAPVWVKKMVVYSHWTGTSGLGWWTGMVELLICSFGVQRCTEPNTSVRSTGRAPGSLSILQTAKFKDGPQTAPNWSQTALDGPQTVVDGPQTALATSRLPQMGPRRPQPVPDGSRQIKMAADCSGGAPGCSKCVPDGP